MLSQTTYWVLLMIGLFVIMYILVPPKQGPELSRFGFWMGLIQAFIILWLGQVFFKLFRAIGDPTLFGIPLLLSLSWIPLTILFAAFFHLADTWPKKAGYILLFAGGTALGQYMLSLFGMWESIKWNPFFTFLLAVVTHSIMTGYLVLRTKKVLN